MTYRSVDVSDQKTAALLDQPAPVLDWLPISRMLIDDTYQRPLGPKNWGAIRKIADNFMWSRFAPVLVAPVENGLYAIIDGQHRVHAAAICGIKTVPAMSVHMSRAEQASAFAWVNGNVTRMTTFNIFKAAIAAKDGWAERIDALVTDAGCRLMTYNKSSKERRAGEVYCVVLIRRLAQLGHGEAVRAGLTAVRASDRHDDITLYSEDVLKPWLEAVASRPEFLAADLTGFLRRHSLKGILALADRVRSRPEYAGASRPQHRRDSIVALLRQHLKGGEAA